MKQISILLSTHNGLNFLYEQMISLSHQTNEMWKLIVRDDGSTDASPAILELVQNQLPQQIDVVKDNFGCLGPSASYLKLLSFAQTPHIMLCDQDDVWLPNKVDMTLDAMRTAEKRFGVDTPLLVHTDLRVVDCNLQPIASSFWEYQNLNPHFGMQLNRVMPQNVVTGCTVMINRSLAKLAMPIPEDAIMHDWWLALVAALFGQVVYLDEPTILYRQHANNTLGAKRWGLKRIVERVQQFQEVRDSMLRTMGQAQAFLDRYRNQMTSEQIALVEAYARLPFMSKAARVGTLFKYRFFKHGLVRNIGFLANLLMLEHSTP